MTLARAWDRSDAPLAHHLLKLAIADAIATVPANRPENDLAGKVPPPEYAHQLPLPATYPVSLAVLSEQPAKAVGGSTQEGPDALTMAETALSNAEATFVPQNDDQGFARAVMMVPRQPGVPTMIRRLVPPLLILPGTVLVLVPASIIWLTHNTRWEAQLVGFDDLRFWVAVLLTFAGLLLAIRTCQLFVTVGKGTPAPWDPPQKLVVQGPYRYVRNPMITSVLFLLAAEALFLASWVLAGWLLVVFLANAVYFPLVEEKALERRFGDHYRLYKANVPRWIPRIRP